MIVLHTCWNRGKFFVWGEQDGHADPCRKERTDGEGVRFSVYDLGAGGLTAVLGELLATFDRCAEASVPLRLALPTMRAKEGFRPIPSFAFLDSDEQKSETENGAELREWDVAAVGLSWREAFELFGLAQEKRLAAEVFAAEDLLRCAELFRYAGALVARGRYLPDLVVRPGASGEACWTPAVDGAERRRIKLLAERLPPSVCCGLRAQDVTEAFLRECVDHLVRASVVTTLSRAQAAKGRYYSVHDAWFAALRGDDRRVRWPHRAELQTLGEQLALWRRPVESVRNQREHLALRLEEPAAADSPWPLRVLRVGNDATTGKKSHEAPSVSEGLLIALGQAILLFPPLAAAERGPEGGLECRLHPAEADYFLTTSGPLLAAAGFDVGLPPALGPERENVLTLAADVSSQKTTVEPEQDRLLDEKVAIQWTVLLNGEPVSREELQNLLQADTPLVFFRGRWIRINVHQLQEALRVGRRDRTDTAHTAAEVVQLALGTGAGCHGLAVSSVKGQGWVDTFLRRLDGEQAFELLDVPPTFCGELRPYQRRGYSWLVCLRKWGFGACLADDMGLGKTIQALAFLLRERAVGEKRPTLLVGPMSVLGNWVREARRFAPGLRCHLHHGANRWHGDSFAQEVQNADVVITSYQLLYRDYSDLRKVAWAGILLDEAQNIKNPNTNQAQAARALQADYRLALTGTPIENHVGDLWSIMDFLNPGLLGKRRTFHEKFFRPIQSGTDPGARARLRRVTTPFLLRRLKTDKQVIADLPEKIENKVYCPLTREQVRLYEEVLEAFNRDIEHAEGVARRGQILAVLTRLKQVCNHPAHYLGEQGALAKRSGKLVRLEEMLEEVFARGESALVFTQYAEMGHLLKKRLCQAFACDMPFLHGGVTRKERDRLVQTFQESKQPLAFVLSLKAGGTGLNLTRARHVFHYDRWWNPAVENQATDRAFRIGQTHNVLVHKFICGGTLEERIDAMIENKIALANEIVTSGEAFLTELSNDELRNVLSLQAAEACWEDEAPEA